jgi:hypothetical protein
LFAALFDQAHFSVQFGLLAGRILALAVGEVLFLGHAGLLDGIENLHRNVDVADQGIVHNDAFVFQGGEQSRGQVVLEFLAPFADDEVACTIGRPLEAGDGEDLGHDDLFDGGGQIAVAAEQPREVGWQEFKLNGHIQADLEAVLGREFDILVEDEPGFDMGMGQRDGGLPLRWLGLH